MRPQHLKWVVGMFLVLATAMPALAKDDSQARHSDDYLQTNLRSDTLTENGNPPDTNLINPWGIASSPTSPFWIADNGTGVSTVYTGAGATVSPPSPVMIPPPSVNPGATAAPTGIVFNGTSDFKVGGNPAHFIFATEDGTISAWASGPSATLEVDNTDTSASSPVFKGLALANSGGTNLLYATNFRNARVDVLGPNFQPFTSLPGHFVDPGIPNGYAPFGIQLLNGKLYVTYAKQDDLKHDDVAGPGHGFIDVFNTDGTLAHRLASRGKLNSPWGLAIAPTQFGEFSNDVLVGNFGDGRISAYSQDKDLSGDFKGQLKDAHERTIVIGDLWGLRVGNGTANGGDANKVYFTAGINAESHGLFGSLESIPEPEH